MFPEPDATEVCPDPQLRITFEEPPALGDSGVIEVFASDGTQAAMLDMSAMTLTDSIGGEVFLRERPAFVEDNTAIIYFSTQLDYGETYYVNVPAGAIVPAAGGLSVGGDTEWRFSTASAPPDFAELSVALDGTGDFCSIQGALDAIPEGNDEKTTIAVKSGVYREINYFSGKNKVTLRGEDRAETILAATNNNNLNPTTRGRALFGADNSSDLLIENLTVHNLTPQGGSQAEALRLQNCSHCTVRSVDVLSLQDTLLWSGTLYAEDCHIEGNVDFIWGTGAAYFNDCEIRTVGRSGYNVQARNGSGQNGYVFVDSRITSDPGITGSVLARIDVSEYPASHVAYINCTLGSHISDAGWLVSGGMPTSELRFWEYESSDENGDPIDTSDRLSGSTQITAEQAEMMRDPAMVLGGWTPQN